VQRFTNLLVWRRSHSLVLEIYKVTSTFPGDERFGMVSQLRRAAASVPTNIAEGSKRRSNTEFGRFLNIAEGSLAEAEYLLVLSKDLAFLPAKAAESLLMEVTEIARMLNALRSKVEKHPLTLDS
jgi:four helix bundle protein